MKIEKIRLAAGSDAFVTCYIQDYSPEMPLWTARPGVMICPGGGYEMVSDREGEPVALRFLSEGYHTFVLTYTVGPKAAFPQPLKELSLAMAAVRERAAEWRLDENKIAVAGFSAGGHLAATLGTLWNHDCIAGVTEPGANRPNALILGYPVISAGRYGHRECFNILRAGRDDIDSLISCELNVGAHTPPAFIFHTTDDGCVPAQNSLLLASAFSDNNIPYALHIYPAGIHGLSLAGAQTCNGWANCVNDEVASWQTLCADWLRGLFGIPEGKC